MDEYDEVAMRSSWCYVRIGSIMTGPKIKH
jgi:hypothetical protein